MPKWLMVDGGALSGRCRDGPKHEFTSMGAMVRDGMVLKIVHLHGDCSLDCTLLMESQVAYQEPAREVDSNPRVSRRTKMLSLGKMVGSRLQTTVMERIRERKSDGSEGSAHSQSRG